MCPTENRQFCDYLGAYGPAISHCSPAGPAKSRCYTPVYPFISYQKVLDEELRVIPGRTGCNKLCSFQYPVQCQCNLYPCIMLISKEKFWQVGRF